MAQCLIATPALLSLFDEGSDHSPDVAEVPLGVGAGVGAGAAVVPPGQLHRDSARANALEDGDGLGVREAARRVPVHRQDLVA